MYNHVVVCRFCNIKTSEYTLVEFVCEWLVRYIPFNSLTKNVPENVVCCIVIHVYEGRSFNCGTWVLQAA